MEFEKQIYKSGPFIVEFSKLSFNISLSRVKRALFTKNFTSFCQRNRVYCLIVDGKIQITNASRPMRSFRKFLWDFFYCLLRDILYSYSADSLTSRYIVRRWDAIIYPVSTIYPSARLISTETSLIERCQLHKVLVCFSKSPKNY